LSSACGTDLKHPFVWTAVEQPCTATLATCTSEGGSSMMRDYNATGEVSAENFMREHGFTEKQSIYRKSDNTYATIIELNDDSIKLKISDGKDGIVHISSFIKGEWEKISRAPKADEKGKTIMSWSVWERYAPHNALAMELKVVQGSIYKALWGLANEHRDIPQWVRIETAPNNVCSLKAFKLHELKLVPSTLKIDCIPDSPDCVLPKGAVDLGVVSMCAFDKYRFWLQPHGLHAFKFDGAMTTDAQKLCVPAWLVQYASDDAHVNMEWSNDLSKCDRTSTAEFEVPILVNSRTVKKGERLFLKKPPNAGVTVVVSVPIEFATPAKKLRTA
jgi:hypothetical protein